MAARHAVVINPFPVSRSSSQYPRTQRGGLIGFRSIRPISSPNAKTYVLGRLSEVSSQIVESRVTEESVVAVTSEVLPIAVHEVVVPPDVAEREGAEGDGRILSGVHALSFALRRPVALPLCL